VGDASLRVPLSALPVGSRTRIRILARDVSLALESPQHSSIQNDLPARVLDIQMQNDAPYALVRLAAADAVLLARITRRAVDQLQLAPNIKVHAQVKAVALISH
jgi:molybdate transport system ATP-binding protein